MEPKRFELNPQYIESSKNFQKQANQRVEQMIYNTDPVEFDRKRVKNMVLASALILGASGGLCAGTMYLVNLLSK